MPTATPQPCPDELRPDRTAHKNIAVLSVECDGRELPGNLRCDGPSCDVPAAAFQAELQRRRRIVALFSEAVEKGLKAAGLGADDIERIMSKVGEYRQFKDLCDTDADATGGVNHPDPIGAARRFCESYMVDRQPRRGPRREDMFDWSAPLSA